MNWLWIAGWAVPPEWLAAQAQAARPEARHTAVAPADAARALADKDFDALGGYSLGALWLLRHRDKIAAETPVLLLAPIFAFAADARMGGKMMRAQLRLQRRRLRDRPADAVADFFRRAGLVELINNPEAMSWNLARTPALDEELSWLEDWQAFAPPTHWRGHCGGEDAFLDAAVLRKIWPALHIVPGASHAPGPLLQAAKPFLLETPP